MYGYGGFNSGFGGYNSQFDSYQNPFSTFGFQSNSETGAFFKGFFAPDSAAWEQIRGLITDIVGIFVNKKSTKSTGYNGDNITPNSGSSVNLTSVFVLILVVAVISYAFYSFSKGKKS